MTLERHLAGREWLLLDTVQIFETFDFTQIVLNIYVELAESKQTIQESEVCLVFITNLLHFLEKIRSSHLWL